MGVVAQGIHARGTKHVAVVPSTKLWLQARGWGPAGCDSKQVAVVPIKWLWLQADGCGSHQVSVILQMINSLGKNNLLFVAWNGLHMSQDMLAAASSKGLVASNLVSLIIRK